MDVFVVRALVVPALLTLVGGAGAWPNRRFRRAPATAGDGVGIECLSEVLPDEQAPRSGRVARPFLGAPRSRRERSAGEQGGHSVEPSTVADGSEESPTVANGTDRDYRAVAMSSGNMRTAAIRLLVAAAAAALLATSGPAAVSASAPAVTAPSAHHPHYLRVASWNISGILTDGKGSSAHAPWRDRRATIARQLLAQAPVGQRGKPADVIALQEANAEKKLPSGRTQYTDLVYRLNHNATGATRYRKITTDLQSKATRIVYNAHTVTLLKRGALKWTAQESKADGPRMMAWAIFRHRSTGKKFFFASVHLETASKAVRKKQWKQLIQAVPRLAHGHPAVIGGDFNATRNQKGNAAAEFLPKMKKAGFGDTLGQTSGGNLKISGTRPHRVNRGNLNSVNFYQRTLGHAWSSKYVGQDVDYLFASNRLPVRGWSMVVNVPHGSNKLRGMVPSDHNLIRAKIVIKR